MINKYHTHSQTQAQHSIESHIFGNRDVAVEPIALNYFEKRFVFLKAKCNALKNKNGAKPFIMEYLELRANNLSGVLIWCSHEMIAEDLGLNRQTVIKCLSELERDGLIFVNRSHGFKQTNEYRVNYGVVYDIPKLKKEVETIQNRKALKRRQTSLPSDVAPVPTHTTKRSQEERSINTYENNTSISLNVLEVYPAEPVEPIPITEEWLPKYQTHKNLKNRLGVTDEFVEEETLSFIISVMNPENKLYGQIKSPDEWNRIFYGHCEYSLKHYNGYKSDTVIKFRKRLIYNENRAKAAEKPVVPVAVKSKPAFEFDRSPTRELRKGEPVEWGSDEWIRFWDNWHRSHGVALSTKWYLERGLKPPKYDP